MQIRSELSALVDDIRSAAKCWNGGEKIKIGQVEMTVAQVAQNVLDKLNTYQIEEKSMKGRIETSQNLLHALNDLRDRSSDPDKEKALISALRKVNAIVAAATQAQRDLAGKVVKEIEKKNNDYINENFTGSSDRSKITKNAYRTLKGVSGWRESVLAHYGIGGSRQLMSYITLQQDLNAFLDSYGGSITDHQRSLIIEIIGLLAKGAEMDREITRLLLLRFNNGAPDEVIESGIADLAYKIENSIDSLKVGESFVFPGGYADSGHSVLYQVQRVGDGEYQFAIFNTGLGAEFGQNFLQLFKIETGISNQSRVPLFAKLPRVAITDQKFLMDLLRFLIKDTPNGMDAVHQTIVKQLKDKFSAVLTTRELHDLQTWGTCSFDSVAAFLEYKFPPSLFIPFQYDMMLRARGELNDLLPKGGMDSRVLEFIDRKSCETIADWKTKFDAYCSPYKKGDLTIAKIANIQNMHDQNEFKKLLEVWGDHDAADYNNKPFPARWAHNLMSNCPSGNDPLEDFSKAEFFLKCGAILPTASIGVLTESFDETVLSDGRRRFLWGIQNLLNRQSPEAAKMLVDRNQALGSGNKPVFGNEIDLSGVFNYLKMRYEEIALCIAPLLNSTLPPLKEAYAGCPKLPVAPEASLDRWVAKY